MLDTNTLATLATTAADNMAFNLDFIPADKLDWKPAEGAKSALEVAHEVARNFRRFAAYSKGEEAALLAPFANAESAKNELHEAARGFAEAVRSLTSEQAARTVEFRPGMSVPVGQLAAMATVDSLHHHGQIAYIQTLLGDGETHFAPDVRRSLA